MVAERDRVLHIKQTHIDPLMQELSLYKRWRYGKRSEQLDPAQASLLEETMDAHMATTERKSTRCSRRYPPSLRRRKRHAA